MLFGAEPSFEEPAVRVMPVGTDSYPQAFSARPGFAPGISCHGAYLVRTGSSRDSIADRYAVEQGSSLTCGTSTQESNRDLPNPTNLKTWRVGNRCET